VAVARRCRFRQRCIDFLCSWLVDDDGTVFGDEWFPAKCKMVLSVGDDKVLTVHVDPGFPNAWRNEPYYSQLLHFAKLTKEAKRGHVQLRIGHRFITLGANGSEREAIHTQAYIEGRTEPL
jgi:hypothetical protein